MSGMIESPDIAPADIDPAREPQGDNLPADSAGMVAVERPVLTEDQNIEAASDQELDSFNADDVIRLRNYDIATLSSAASFGAIVPAALESARSILLWTIERHGEFSLTNGGGTLENYFKELMGLGKDGDNSQDGEDDALEEWSGYIERAQEREREKRQMQDDLRSTRSEAEIDAMAWVGNPDDLWTLGKVSASRKQWLAGAKAARKKIDEDESLTDAQKIHLKRQLSDIEVAIKEGDYEKVARLKQELPKEYQDTMDDAALQPETTSDLEVSANTAHDAASKQSGTEISATAGAEILEDDVSASKSVANPEPATAAPSGLASAPDIELKEEFTEVAKPGAEATTQAPAQVATLASTTPKLNMTRDI